MAENRVFGKSTIVFYIVKKWDPVLAERTKFEQNKNIKDGDVLPLTYYNLFKVWYVSQGIFSLGDVGSSLGDVVQPWEM